MKFILSILFAFGIFSLNIQASGSPEDNVRAQLCTTWKYDFDIHAYVCRVKSAKVEVVTASNYENTVATLEDRIEELEKRLEKLESK